MMDPDLRRFLERLATAAGIAAIPLMGAADTGDTGGTEQVCVDDAVVDGACPNATDALAKFQLDWSTEAGCPVTAVLGDGTLSGSTHCCYDVQLACEGDTGYPKSPINYGCMGRPFLEEGRVVAASVTEGAGRGRAGGRDLLPDVTGLDATRREILTRFWLRVGLAEHASIAEFHRVALELIRLGAPTELLARAQVAAVDEARHARRCFAVASAYAGRALAPGPLPIAATVSLSEDLVALATATARDGCVAETCSAWLYARLADRARDSAVKAVFAGVVRDETRHAELAWATLRWAIATGGKPVRDAAWDALTTPPPSAPEHAADDALLAAHGWAPAHVQDRFATEAWKRLVLPLAQAVCG